MTEQLYRIKPLEWHLSGGIFYTRTIVGNFSLLDNVLRLSTWTEDESRSVNGVEDGKAKALAWYLERLMPVLEVQS